jgi:hypothetical protein
VRSAFELTPTEGLEDQMNALSQLLAQR